MKKEDYYIYGKHAVYSALNNTDRKIDEVFCIDNNNTEIKNKIQKLITNNKNKIKLNYINVNSFENIVKKDVKHQGVLAKAHKLNIKSYLNILDKNRLHEMQYGVILDRITDPHNIGAIYRTANAFGIDFILNTNRNSVIENSTILNAACGAFETMQTFITNNITNAIRNFISKGWWIVALDHQANSNIDTIIKKMNNNDKIIFVFGSEGKGIRRLIKENCNFIVKIPNAPNTQSINVSNAAAIVFYEIFKLNKNI